MTDFKHTPDSNNGTISRAEIMRHLRFELRESKNTGKGPRRITVGLHFAESIIHHLRKDEAAPELLKASKRALAAMLRTTAPDYEFTDAVDELDAAIVKGEKS